MINATGGDSHSSPPPGHGVLDSGATTTVLAGEHHRYFTQYETAPTVTSWQRPREEALLR
jgi:hypothetical protein